MARDPDVLRAIDQSPLRRKGTLETWMRTNRVAFGERLNDRIADWLVMARLFADAGLTDRYGNPPKPETARKTWQRVRRKGAQEKHRAPVESTPSVRPVKPASGAPTSTDDILAMLSPGSKLPDPINPKKETQ